MVNFGQSAIPRNLDGRYWFVGIAGHRQRERRFIVRLRASKRSNDKSGIQGFGDGEELNGEVFLSLSTQATSAVENPVHSTSAYQLKP
jgi:hypothetical protein